MSIWEVGPLQVVTRGFLSTILSLAKGGKLSRDDFGRCSEDLAQLKLFNFSISSCIKAFWKNFVFACIYAVGAAVGDVLRIFLIFSALVSFLSDVSQRQWYGWLMVTCLFAFNVLTSVFLNQYLEEAAYFAARIKTNLNLQLIKMIVEIDSEGNEMTQRVNRMVGPDTYVIYEFFQMAPGLVFGLMLVILAGTCTYIVIGWVCLPFLVASAILIIWIEFYGGAMALAVDELFDCVGNCAKNANEVFRNMFHIKVQVLENRQMKSFAKIMTTVSEKTKSAFFSLGIEFMLNQALQVSPRLITFAIALGTAAISDLDTFFTSLPLLISMQVGVVEVGFALARLRLCQTSLNGYETFKQMPRLKPVQFREENGGFCVACHKLKVGDTDRILNIGDLHLPFCKFTFVVGPSGSGKSLFLARYSFSFLVVYTVKI